MTPMQRTLITDLIAAELADLVTAARAAGVSPDTVNAVLERRIEAVRNMPPKLRR